MRLWEKSVKVDGMSESGDTKMEPGIRDVQYKSVEADNVIRLAKRVRPVQCTTSVRNAKTERVAAGQGGTDRQNRQARLNGTG